jgi:hypothetical protein
MSIHVGLVVTIANHRAERKVAIRKSLKQSWGFTNVEEKEKVLVACHEADYPRDPVSEESLTKIAEGIWEANGGYCQIGIVVTYVQTYPFQKTDYDQWQASLN